VNEQEQKQFIQSLTERLKEIHHLTVIYEVAVQFAKDYGVPSMDEVLEAARKSPEILAESEKRLARLDERVGLTPEVDQSEAVLKWLQQWKSSGKPN
jgi:hypothetical protein